MLHTLKKWKELPSAFVREYWHELCKTAILEGPSGQTWSVDVSGTECIMNFKNGWQAFSFDHNLNEGDIVIFKLTTKAYFVVQVFDKDGCEKDLCGVQNSAAFALQCGTSSSKQRKKRIHPQKNLLERTNKHLELEKVANTCGLVAGGKKLSLDSEIGHDNKGGLHSTSCVDVDRTENRKKLKRCPLKGSSGVNSVDSHCSDPDCDDMNLLQDLIMSCKNINAANHQEEVTDGSSMPLTTLKQVIDLDSYKRKTVSGRKHIHDLNQEGSKTWSVEKKNSCLRIVSDTMAAAKSHNSSNPTVIVKMKYSQVTSGFWLCLGRNFAREWLPLDNTDAFLVNSAGCRWKVKWLWHRGGFSAGWRRFSLDHGLQEKDVCLFELTSKTPLEFVVHMFRLRLSSYSSY